jgi:hypothetical protein
MSRRALAELDAAGSGAAAAPSTPTSAGSRQRGQGAAHGEGGGAASPSSSSGAGARRGLFRRLVFDADIERHVALSALGGAALALLAVLLVADRWLKTDLAPMGTRSLEFAGSRSAGQAVLRSWSPAQRVLAAFLLGLHFLTIPLWSTAICYACTWAADLVRERPELFEGTALAKAGDAIGHVQYVAALADGAEHLLLVSTLLKGPDSASHALAFPLATAAALFKFLIVLLGLGYALGVLAHVRLAASERFAAFFIFRPRTLRRRASSRKSL